MFRLIICFVALVSGGNLSVAQTVAPAIPLTEQSRQELYSQLKAPAGAFSFVLALALAEKVIPGQESQRQAGYSCAATLIAARWAITMAYCFDVPSKSTSADKDRFTLLYGDPDLSKGRTVAIRNVIRLPETTPTDGARNSQLALLELERDLPGAIQIAHYAHSPKRTNASQIGNAVVTGWGYITTSSIYRDGLNHQLKLTVRVVDKYACNARDFYSGRVTADQFCAQSAFEGVDVCQGFGGAPLVVANRFGDSNVLGLVNWGDGCAQKKRPTVYTDLTHHIEAITKIVGAAVLGPPPDDSYLAGSVRGLDLPRESVLEAHGLANSISGRIVAPRPTVPPFGKYRYVVSIGTAGKPADQGHRCGGVFINPRWVLTAAHCVRDFVDNPAGLLLRPSIDSDVLMEPVQRLRPKKIVVHKDAHTTPFNNHKNDIALVEVEPVQPFPIKTPPLLRAQDEVEFLKENVSAYTTGYGMDSRSPFGRLSVYLHEIEVPIIPRSKCNAKEGFNGLVDENEFCAGGNGVDSCQGDSGGPLIIWGGEKYDGYLLAGLVSWGRGCGTNQPGVYVRIPAFEQWLRENIK